MNQPADTHPTTSPWHRVSVLIFAVTVLLACKLSEEVRLNKDGSGSYRAELLLEGEEKHALRDFKAELEKRPQLKILDEGPRGADYFIVFGMDFNEVSEVSDDPSTYSWSVSEAGAFKRKARLVVANDWEDQMGLAESILEITMPGKVVDTNAENVSGNKVVWDRLEAGSQGRLYVESEYTQLPAGYSTKIALAAAVLAAGIVLLVVLRLRRRKT